MALQVHRIMMNNNAFEEREFKIYSYSLYTTLHQNIWEYRSLTFRNQIEKLQKKLKTRVNLLQKLARTGWGGGRCHYSKNGNNRVSVFYSGIWS